jgi:hypothetical protein
VGIEPYKSRINAAEFKLNCPNGMFVYFANAAFMGGIIEII